MGYAARANRTAAHFATPEGIAESRAIDSERERQRAELVAARRRAEWDTLASAVRHPNNPLGLSPQRLALATAHLAKQGARG